MEPKYTFKKVKSKHDGDCWCIAISLMLGKKYDEVYEMYKPFINKDGTLNCSIIKGTMLAFDISQVEYDMTLYDTLQTLDSRNGIMIDLQSSNGGHIVYCKNNVIYDNIENKDITWYLIQHKVTNFYIKLDETFKYV